MFFKNAIFYICKVELDLDMLQDQMEKFRFKPTAKREPKSTGWESPFGDGGEMLFHAANNCVLMRLRHEECLLPGKVVKAKVDDKVAYIQQREDRKVYRKEQQVIKDDIIHDLLPQAFRSSKYTWGYLDMTNGYLIVDSSSYRAAEVLINLLRETLGSLPLMLIQVAHSPAVEMTRWITEANAPEKVVLGDEIDLSEFGEGGSKVKCRQIDLFSEEIGTHITHGSQVSKLNFKWDDNIDLILEDDLSVKRLKFGERLVCEAEEASEDPESRIDADLVIMSGNLAQFANEMIEWFGGLRQMELDL